ncbi:MAG: DNA repair protein [Clostridia bacterium]|nr:DNA repair protein [Clostridia bacterium]
MKNTYLIIDLKSFYASVECVERGLDPMTANLVVADGARSDKTICLAVSPSMKKLGVKNRCRVFEIPATIEYIMATPRMRKYIDYAAEIYGIYLRHFSKDDIFVYSIDEAFIDVTHYLKTYNMTAREMAVYLMEKIYDEVGVRATCGIGTNLYLAKIALDITAKHAPDFIGELNEETFKETLWDHTPLTDFWRIGPGTAKHLMKYGIYTMRQIAEAPEDLLYRAFGIDAELMIDHANGIEPVMMKDIKGYRPRAKSITAGQVLMSDYPYDKARIICAEMADEVVLRLVREKLVTSSITLSFGYANKYDVDFERGTVNFGRYTNSSSEIIPKVVDLFDRLMDRSMEIRRFYINVNNVIEDPGTMQLSMFDNKGTIHDNRMVQAVNDIKDKFGKSAIFKGMDLEEGATALERNRQIGGHKSGE